MSDAAKLEEFRWAADLIYTELRRAWPEELTKQEVLTATGISTDEGRAGLQLLQLERRLDEEAGQLKAKVDSESPDAAAPEEEEPPEAVAEVEPPESTAPTAGGVGGTYHAHYDLSVAFGGSLGQSPEATVKSAKAMEEQIADRVHKMYPGAVVGVELKKIEVFDRPRRIYGEEDEDGG